MAWNVWKNVDNRRGQWYFSIETYEIKKQRQVLVTITNTWRCFFIVFKQEATLGLVYMQRLTKIANELY